MSLNLIINELMQGEENTNFQLNKMQQQLISWEI